jgi:acyl transferase domain-containing protein
LTKNGRAEDVDYVSVLLRGKDAVASSLEAIGKLWTKGQSVHLLRVNSQEANAQPLQSLTNLPNYPWNHTKKYWHESARAINCRFRKTPRLDLLGSPVQDFNPLEPRWRNITRLAEIPWLSDYKTQGSILLSAASMLCAVIEAAQQVAKTTEMIQGFEFRDILIHRALAIPSGEGGISTALQVKPRKAGTRAKESFWYEFAFYSEPKDQRVIEHCSGLLQIQYKTIEKEVDAEAIAESNIMKMEHAKYQLICKKCVNPRQFYETWRSNGLQWGKQS